MRVTHPFHPLFGRVFEFVEARQNWGEDRVVVRDEDGDGVLFSLLPTAWTDAAALDPAPSQNPDSGSELGFLRFRLLGGSR